MDQSDENLQKDNPIPITDTAILTAIDELKTEVETIGAEVKSINGNLKTMITKEVDSRGYIKEATVNRRLEGYSTSDDIQIQLKSELAKVADGILEQFTRVVNDLSQKVEKQDGKINQNTSQTERNARENDKQQQQIADLVAQLPTISSAMNRIEKGITEERRSHEVTRERVLQVEINTKKLPDLLHQLTQELNEVRARSVEHEIRWQRLVNEQEQARLEALEQRKRLKEMAWYVATRGLGTIGGLISTGAIGAALVALGQALMGH